MSCAEPMPPIYTRPPEAEMLGARNRFFAAGAAIIGGAILTLAAFLKPNHAGVGTHTSIGLDRCQFLLRTGIPCPSCGMTTSFTWFAHGNLLAAVYVQPMGVVLAILTAVLTWTAAYIAITGKPTHRLLRLVPSRYYALPLLMFAVLAWGWKIWIHLHGVDGW